MTKHDIRIRRGSFSKGQIERHKDFKKFSGLYERQKRRGFNKMILILIAILMAVVVIVYGYWKFSSDEKNSRLLPDSEQVEMTKDYHA